MKMKILLNISSLVSGFIFSMTAFLLPAQSFIETGDVIAGAGRGEISWCDYDNDHDLDVLVTGRGLGEERITLLYRNDNSLFMNAGVSFIPVEESMASWGDYDFDGDRDLLIAGNSENGDITLIYSNDGGSFTQIDPGIAGIQQGVVQWVDIDSDNDLDIFISGSWITEIYENEGGIFTDDGQDFGFFSSSAASFGDFDNDGDLDLLITGDSGAGAVSKIFKNESGVFIDSEISFTGLMAGTAEWVDYDSDGDLDAAISGFNDALEAQFCLYKNQDKQFEIIYTGIEGFALGSANWGDYDNDGDPDLLMSGKANGCGAIVSGIYRNDGNDFFYKISQEITTAIRCSLGWADYDNDGDLDFLISGLSYSDDPFTKIYLNLAGNNQFVVNTPPAAPDLLTTETEGDAVSLTWLAAYDDQTPSVGLSYNFRLGTSPGANDIVSPMADVADGYRRITGPGNAGQALSMYVVGLVPGTYFWSVQAIDQALEGSAFATEQSFTIIATKIEEIEIAAFRIYPNPVTDYLFIENIENVRPFDYIISDLTGKILHTGSSFESLTRIDVSALKPGVYLVTSRAKEKEIKSCIFKTY